MSKTHFKSQSDSPYIGSWDLPDYKDIVVTVAEVKAELTEGLKENKVMNIAYFKEDGLKPMLLNSTNSKRLKTFTRSPYIEDWTNVKITLSVESGVKAFGEVHDALRIRPTQPKTTKLAITPESSLWAKAKVGLAGGATYESLNKNYRITKANFKKLTDEQDQ